MKKILILPILILLSASLVFAFTATMGSNYADGAWATTEDPQWNLTISGNGGSTDNTFNCTITSLGTVIGKNSSITNLSSPFINLTEKTFTGNATKYNWSILCYNSTGGSATYVAANRTIGIDSTPPTVFNCTDVNATVSPVYGFQINWSGATTSTDNMSGFARYNFVMYNGTSRVVYNISPTSNGTQRYSVSLNPYNDSMYSWWVMSYDVAGNNRSATNCNPESKMFYRFEKECSVLTTGWNVCGAFKTGASLGQVCNDTMCQYISRYNQSNHEWITYSNGSTTNAGETFNEGEAMFIYAGTTRHFGYVFDPTETNVSIPTMSWNFTTHNIGKPYLLSNGSDLSNASLWNINCVTNVSGYKMYAIKDLFEVAHNNSHWATLDFNNTIPFYSYVNQSGANYVPAVWNFTINDNATINYGECIWSYDNNRSIAYGNVTI